MNKALSYVLKNSAQDMLVDVCYLMKFEGYGVLARKIEEKRLRQLPRYTKTSTNLFGRRIDVIDPVSYVFMIDEIFREEIYYFETDVASPLIVDGGANTGLSTIFFKRLYPNSRVIAFEPDANLVRNMQNNLALFNITDVEIIQKALWDEDTTLNFFSEGSDGGRIASPADDRQNTMEVEAVSLRPFIQQRVDYLKLDIEGAEWRVLESIRNQLTFVQHIFVEFHSFFGKQQHLGDVIGLLEGAGFRLNVTAPVKRAWRPMAKRNTWNGMDLQLNIFGWREACITKGIQDTV